MFEVVAELPMLALILQRGRHADAHRLEVGVVDVGGNDHAAARHFGADQLRLEALAAATYSISSVTTPWRA